jgi:hypothetical protein
VVGGAPVHLTGYYSPEFGADMDDEEGEEGEEEDADYALVSVGWSCVWRLCACECACATVLASRMPPPSSSS